MRGGKGGTKKKREGKKKALKRLTTKKKRGIKEGLSPLCLNKKGPQLPAGYLDSDFPSTRPQWDLNSPRLKKNSIQKMCLVFPLGGGGAREAFFHCLFFFFIASKKKSDSTVRKRNSILFDPPGPPQHASQLKKIFRLQRLVIYIYIYNYIIIYIRYIYHFVFVCMFFFFLLKQMSSQFCFFF